MKRLALLALFLLPAFAHADSGAYINVVDTNHQYYFLTATSSVKAAITTGFQDIKLQATSTTGTIISDQGSDTLANFDSYFANASVATNLGNFVTGGSAPQADGVYVMSISKCTTGGSPGFVCGTGTVIFTTTLTKAGDTWSITGNSSANGTRITLVEPFPGSTIATSSQLILEASGFLNSADAHANDYIQWDVHPLTADCPSLNWATGCTGAAGELSGRSFRANINPVFPDTDQSFDISSTTLFAMDQAGVYLMHTAVKTSNSTFFGLIPLPDVEIVATTSTFTVGQSTTLDQILAASANLVATTTAANLSSCIPIPGYFILSNCVFTLFVPSTRPDYQFGALANKPPFGYWTQMVALFQNASTTGAASTTPVGIGTIGSILSPLVTGLSAILWFLLALWIFHRLRNFNFQS